MGFFDQTQIPVTSFIDSFVKNVFMDKVKPKIGSILKVDLAGGFACHTGVYIGNGEIVELYENNGTGEVRIVSPKRFLHGESDSVVRTGIYIYCACADDIVLYSDEIAERARDYVGYENAYELMGKNCHAFVTYCITGEKLTKKSVTDEARWSLLGVERLLEEYFSLDLNSITWRSAAGKIFDV